MKKIDTLREKKNGYLGKGQNSKPRNEKTDGASFKKAASFLRSTNRCDSWLNQLFNRFVDDRPVRKGGDIGNAQLLKLGVAFQM